jgi:hypothetical protein
VPRPEKVGGDKRPKQPDELKPDSASSCESAGKPARKKATIVLLENVYGDAY